MLFEFSVVFRTHTGRCSEETVWVGSGVGWEGAWVDAGFKSAGAD